MCDCSSKKSEREREFFPPQWNWKRTSKDEEIWWKKSLARCFGGEHDVKLTMSENFVRMYWLPHWVWETAEALKVAVILVVISIPPSSHSPQSTVISSSPSCGRAYVWYDGGQGAGWWWWRWWWMYLICSVPPVFLPQPQIMKKRPVA